MINGREYIKKKGRKDRGKEENLKGGKSLTCSPALKLRPEVLMAT